MLHHWALIALGVAVIGGIALFGWAMCVAAGKADERAGLK